MQLRVVGFGAGVGFVVGCVLDWWWLSVAFHWAACSWKWEALSGSGRFWYFFTVLSNICSQLYSFRGQVSENPKSLHYSSCFQQQLPFVHGQMENENPVCILCPVFSLMGRFRYFSYLNDIKTQKARLALGQSSVLELMGECAFCNCASGLSCFQEISKTDSLPLEEQSCLIKPGVCQITAAPFGLFCANPIWQHHFVPARFCLVWWWFDVVVHVQPLTWFSQSPWCSCRENG